MSRVVAFAPDLMDRSRLSTSLGADVEHVPTLGRLTARLGDTAAEVPDAVVIDLGRPGVLDALRSVRAATTARLVGFGSHVERDLLDAARAAGCDEVLPRSRFFADVAAALVHRGRSPEG